MALKAFAICKKDSDGGPDIGFGWDRWSPIEGDLTAGLRYGMFIIVGSGAQLTAISNHANCWGGMLVSSNGGTRWQELDQPVPTAFRNRANPFLTANGLPTIGAAVTVLQLIRRVKAGWDFGDSDCWIGE